MNFKRALETMAGLVVIVVVVGIVLAYRAGSAASSGASTAAASSAPSAVAAVVDVDLDPSVSPEPPAGRCLVHALIIDTVPMSLEDSARRSESVVVGTVEEVGAAQWRTADGLVPKARPDVSPANVMRLIRISVSDDVAGKAVPQELVAWIPGGQIGCHRFEVDSFPATVEKGQTFMFFMRTSRPPTAKLSSVAEVVEMWPVEGTSVMTPYSDKPISTSEVAGTVESALGSN